MSTDAPEYILHFDESEIRALRAAVAADPTNDALVSAIDKLQWSVDFLDAPETFHYELAVMRVPAPRRSASPSNTPR